MGMLFELTAGQCAACPAAKSGPSPAPQGQAAGGSQIPCTAREEHDLNCAMRTRRLGRNLYNPQKSSTE